MMIILFSLILFCKKELTEEQEVALFVTEYINFAIDNADSRIEKGEQKLLEYLNKR